MKHKAFLAFILFSVVPCPPRAAATIVGTGLISQPAYLGNASQPDRIPLAPVIYNANHGYGSHTAIFQSRPCFHGSFHADGKPEYEQNLAVLFGISCELSDPTQMPGCTASFRLRSVRPPSNAPYSQEQVLAVSLQTLLLHSRGMSKAHPLTVEVTGDGIPKPAWAARYEGHYFYPDEQFKGHGPWKPLPVPGVGIDETSLPGVTYLTLPGVAPDPKIEPRTPVFIPFTYEGECGDDGTVLLVPVWHGDSWNHPLCVLEYPVLPYYEKWHAGAGGWTRQNDALPHQTPPNPLLPIGSLRAEDAETVGQIRVVGAEISPDRLAALVFACVASARPTGAKPLRITLDGVALPAAYQQQLNNDPAWQEGTTCEFAIDPATMKLSKGNVPGYAMSYERRMFSVAMVQPAEKMAFNEDPAPPWIAAALEQIKKQVPPVTREQFAEATRDDRRRLNDWDIPADEKIRIMLALWLYGDRPEVFEALWWRSNDRVIRALAVALGRLDYRQPGSSDSSAFELWSEAGRMNAWEAGLRRQEAEPGVVYRLRSAVEEWQKRCEAARATRPETKP